MLMTACRGRGVVFRRRTKEEAVQRGVAFHSEVDLPLLSGEVFSLPLGSSSPTQRV